MTLFAVLLVALPVRAEMPVDLELLLAVDASGSVDAEEFQLQLGGIAEAFRDPEVQEAIASGPLGRIAVALMIWSDARSKKPISPWMMVDNRASAEAFGDLVLTQLPRRKAFLGKGGTGIGAAIGQGIKAIRRNAFAGDRRVIDVSGDGHETPLQFGEAMALPEAHRRAKRRNVTINGLAVVTDDPNLTGYYEYRVIRGPGSFVITANGYQDFARAMKLKLIREIRVLTGQGAGGIRVADLSRGASSDPHDRR